MSALRDLNIAQYIEKYNVKYLIETGTGRGDAIKYASRFPFKKIVSTEIDLDQVNILKNEFKGDGRIVILGGNSPDLLEKEFSTNSYDEPILFWLDSHFPYADLGKAAFDDEKDLSVRLPLSKELQSIYNHRVMKGFRDVILADDLRIYAKGPFKAGNLDSMGLDHIGSYNLDFLKKFEDSHTIRFSYEDTGIITMLPK